MEIEPPRRASSAIAVAECRRVFRIIRTRIGREYRPDAGQRHDIGEIARADQGFAPEFIPCRVVGLRAGAAHESGPRPRRQEMGPEYISPARSRLATTKYFRFEATLP